jgi:hypothetical protein
MMVKFAMKDLILVALAMVIVVAMEKVIDAVKVSVFLLNVVIMKIAQVGKFVILELVFSALLEN